MKTQVTPFPYQQMVEEFMRTSAQKVAAERRSFTMNEAGLRYSLFIEEVGELKEAIDQNDRVEQLDAVCDALYVLIGTASTIGLSVWPAIAELQEDLNKLNLPNIEIGELLERVDGLSVYNIEEAITLIFSIACKLGFCRNPTHIKEAFRRVHISNMSKFDETEKDANISVAQYANQGVKAYWLRREDKYVILRREDGKVLKSYKYGPVDLASIITQIDENN